jgi:hypothetical protein
MAAAVLNEERAQSLEFRLFNEEMLIDRAMESPWLGWGGWGRERVYDDFGDPISIVDGYWIATFGERGVLALVSFYTLFLMMPGLACFRFSRATWRFSHSGPVVALAVLMILYAIDCLLNAMDNAVYPLCLGGISTVMGASFGELIGMEPREREEASPAIVEAPRRAQWPPQGSSQLPVDTTLS